MNCNYSISDTLKKKIKIATETSNVFVFQLILMELSTLSFTKCTKKKN